MLRMADLRKNTRYKALAKATINGVTDKEVLLSNISVTGCCLEIPAYVEIKPNARYKLKIIPEDASGIDSFFLSVEGKWEGVRAGSFECGFNIIESPRGKQFQRYVDYLSWRYSQGNSMIGNAED